MCFLMVERGYAPADFDFWGVLYMAGRFGVDVIPPYRIGVKLKAEGGASDLFSSFRVSRPAYFKVLRMCEAYPLPVLPA